MALNLLSRLPDILFDFITGNTSQIDSDYNINNPSKLQVISKLDNNTKITPRIMSETYDYCPISVKEKKNMPMYSAFPLTNSDIFLSKKNILDIIYYIASLNVKTHTKDVDISKLKVQIPKLMNQWTIDNNINDYESSGDNNIVTNLEFINKKFLLNNSILYDRCGIGEVNVFTSLGRVTDECGRQSNKKYDEMSANDYHTLDVSQPYEAFTYDKRNRYSNKIPVWQKSMQMRNYDRSNDGLHDANPDRSSLDNQIHGYDMSNIIKGSTYYENYYYENM